MKQPTYHFDTLPLHPQPQPLESFTSYLMRLAEANRLKSPGDLGYRLFPGRNPYLVATMSDHVPVTFGTLPQQAHCPETGLLATTFYHLGRKFGRPSAGKAFSSFLNGAIALSLRYCPLCVQEQGYYQLSWRFLALSGCHRHGCRFLDRCAACHQPIRLLHQRLKVGICPTCQIPLAAAAGEPLSASEREHSEQVAQDLTFLLSPQPWETGDTNASTSVGHLLERFRWQRGLHPADVAHLLGCSPLGIRHLERGQASGVGVSFQRYLRYAAYMNVSLQQLFLNELEAFYPLPESQPTRETALVATLQTAIEQLQASGQPVNEANLRQTTGFSKFTFSMYPATKAMLVRLHEQAEQQREEALLERVKQVVQQLRQEGKPVYLFDISRTLKKKSRDLKAHPLIWAYLQQLTPPLAQPPQQGEAFVLARVQETIQFLTENGQRFNHQDIADHLGLATPNLYRHARVKQFLQQLTANQREQEANRILEQVEEAITHLQASNEPITRQAVCLLTGLSRSTLARFPQPDALLTHHLEADKQQRQAERLAQVRQAISYLQQNNLPVTQKAICQTAGLGEGAPHHHPELMAIIQPVLAEEKERRQQHFLERVSAAIKWLLSQNDPLTIATVAQQVGLPHHGSSKFTKPQPWCIRPERKSWNNSRMT